MRREKSECPTHRLSVPISNRMKNPTFGMDLGLAKRHGSVLSPGTVFGSRRNAVRAELATLDRSLWKHRRHGHPLRSTYMMAFTGPVYGEDT